MLDVENAQSTAKNDLSENMAFWDVRVLAVHPQNSLSSRNFSVLGLRGPWSDFDDCGIDFNQNAA